MVRPLIRSPTQDGLGDANSDQGVCKTLQNGLAFSSCVSMQHADVAQLVEHNLAKVGVASSNLVIRSQQLL